MTSKKQIRANVLKDPHKRILVTCEKCGQFKVEKTKMGILELRKKGIKIKCYNCKRERHRKVARLAKSKASVV